jgi:hypothetical protein
MDWGALKKRFGEAGQSAAATFTLPDVILEIQSGFVLGARLETSGRSPVRVRRIEVREAEARSQESPPAGENVSNTVELRRPLGEILSAVGDGNRSVGLLLPDGIVRVATLTFETLPERHQEACALVRWKMREVLAFPPEEARLSFQVLRRDAGLVEILALAAQNAVLSEYETAIDRLGRGPSLILPATAALLPLIPDGAKTAELLVHVCSSSVTTVVLEGGLLRTWRNRDLSGISVEDAVREVGREAARIVASSRDRLGVDLGRVWLCARPPAGLEQVEELMRAVAHPVELLRPGSDLAPILSTDGREVFERYGATVAGLISNSA